MSTLAAASALMLAALPAKAGEWHVKMVYSYTQSLHDSSSGYVDFLTVDSHDWAPQGIEEECFWAPNMGGIAPPWGTINAGASQLPNGSWTTVTAHYDATGHAVLTWFPDGTLQDDPVPAQVTAYESAAGEVYMIEDDHSGNSVVGGGIPGTESEISSNLGGREKTVYPLYYSLEIDNDSIEDSAHFSGCAPEDQDRIDPDTMWDGVGVLVPVPKSHIFTKSTENAPLDADGQPYIIMPDRTLHLYAKAGGHSVGFWSTISYIVQVAPNPEYSLSTLPDAAAQVGGNGSPGAYPGNLFWDGTVDECGNPREGSTRRLSPEEKDYYAVVNVKVTLPRTISPPDSITAVAERIKYVNNDVTVVGGTGNSEDIYLYLIDRADDIEGGAPVVTGNNRTWTYRSHYLRDREAQVVEGASDWHVTNKLGRWRLRVKNELSNRVEFKIDKRNQIVGYARDWASLNLSNNQYPQGVPWACSAFTDHLVYERLGLPSDTDLDDMKLAPDSGNGTLAMFYGKGTRTGAFGGGSHVAIRDGGERIDSNVTLNSEPFTVRGLFDYANDYLPEAYYPYWGTVVIGAPKNPATGNSILQDLDGE